jgi:N-acetylmuramoyl-L-alanine amidase
MLATLILFAALQTGPVITGPVIVIDPGHPSETSGGDVVQHGTTEVHVAWVVADRLARRLRAAGYAVVLTKSSEREYVRNRERAAIANRAGAALMVRLHCDASPDSGYAIYYPSRTGTVEGRTGPAASVIAASQVAADSLHAGMAAVLGDRLHDGGVRGDDQTFVGSRQGALTGSVFSDVPVVLIEMVVLRHSADAVFITSAAGEELMARAIETGIERAVKDSHL